MNEISVWIVNQFEYKKTVIKNTLEELQSIVGGYIEAFGVGGGNVVICDEEGKLKGKKLSGVVHGERIVGTFIVAGTDGDEFANCNLDEHEIFELVGWW